MLAAMPMKLPQFLPSIHSKVARMIFAWPLVQVRGRPHRRHADCPHRFALHRTNLCRRGGTVAPPLMCVSSTRA